MEYYGKVFRPPSEARSLILQCTIGCSHNQCTFCGMYKEDRFRIRPLKDILRDLEEMAPHPYYRRIFLGDGDALILPTPTLKVILERAYRLFPQLERVGIYASPKSIATKSLEDLRELRKSGLGILYLGLESGSEEILHNVNKGSTAKEILAQAHKVKKAGILLSVTLISGLGGQNLSREHALKSAAIISQMAPDYLGLLTLMREAGTPLDEEIRKGQFSLLRPREILEETRLFIESVEGKNILFRANHASNYLNLKGVLDQDKERLLLEIDRALREESPLRQEAYRSL